MIFAIAAAFVLLSGRLYRLNAGYTIVLFVMVLLFLPVWLKNNRKAGVEKARLLDAEIYMEQLLYAFSRQGQLSASLKDILQLFPEGDMHQVLEQAVHTVLHDYEKEDALKCGLQQIEDRYPNDRLRMIHRFLYQAEIHGGEYEGVLLLLLKDLNHWKMRMDAYRKECAKVKRNVCTAIGIAWVICMVAGYLLPERLDMEQSGIRMMSTVLFAFFLMLIYTRTDQRLAVDWLRHGYKKPDQKLEKKYQDYVDDTGEKIPAASLILSVVPLLAGMVALGIQAWTGVVLCGMLFFFFLNQHKIGRRLAGRRLKREIEIAFPQWLMELSLLLQTNNVQVAIAETMPQAPYVLRPALGEFWQQITAQPESVQPYLDFLKAFSLPQVQAAMKMLYGVSAGNGGNELQQMEELIVRNQQLMRRSEELYDEDAMAGMYLLFLSPAVAGAGKLLCDMTLFLFTFFTQVSV